VIVSKPPPGGAPRGGRRAALAAPVVEGLGTVSAVTHRTIRRAAAVLTGLILPLLVATPALARDDGEIPSHIGTWYVIGVYIAVPLLVFLGIVAFVTLPATLRAPRYRPGKPWHHDPLWFGGPDDPEAALQGVRAGVTSKGGARAEW